MFRGVLLLALPCALCQATPKPNIVFILADDLGYNEMGFMNETRGLQTPNLDALAKGGVVLKNYYVQPICSPTRSALMTGRVPMHLGTQGNVIYWDTPWAIDVNETFLPQNLQDAGYHTGMFGKWHLGMFQESATPRRRGFDEHMGYFQGCQSHQTHIAACCDAGAPTGDKNFVCSAKSQGPEDFRGYDWFKSGSLGGKSEPDPTANHTSSALLIGDAALDYISRKATIGKPFYLYLPFQNIHKPYTVEERYRDLYNHSGITEAEKTMWGYISEMDAQVGRIVEALKAHPGVYERTVIVFSSDNGAPPAGGDVDHDEHLVPGLHPPWIARNYPFRGSKTQIWEGGTRVPAFVHSQLLPSKVHGTQSHELFHITDWLPTLVGLAGGSVTRNKDLDGHNIWNSISSASPSPRNEILYNINPLCHGGQAAAPKAGIRVGQWKLLSWCYEIAGIAGSMKTGPVSAPKGESAEFQDGPVLFDLDADPRETTNVAAQQPKVVKDLLARLSKWAEGSVEPMQRTAPYQGDHYFCKDCPLHPAGTGPGVPWTSWIGDDGTPLQVPMSATPFAETEDTNFVV